MTKILIIDDDKDICKMMVRELERKSYDIQTANSVSEGIDLACRENYDVVFLDLRMPDGSGLNLLKTFQNRIDAPEIIIITAFAEPQSAETAMKSGVWDYLKKPFSIHEMRATLERALQYHKEKKQPSLHSFNRSKIIGDSPVMAQCIDLIAKAVEGNVGVLINGETGTGKELFAGVIHENSSRAGKNMVVLDCTVLPENLMESVLFGHVKGAFTGADASHEGLIRQADGGTLFLDEVGELPFALQKKFLRVLQEQTYRQVGSREECRSDFRLIAATNRDLEEMVKKGEFRKDLLYRLKNFTIEIPPLRERKEDVEALAYHHVNRLCLRYEMAPKRFSDELTANLQRYSWPGNVRELVNTIDRMLTVARSESTLYSVHLPSSIRLQLVSGKLSKRTAPAETDSLKTDQIDISRPLKDVREEMIRKMETAYLKRSIEETGGDLKSVCKSSGLARSQLYNLIKKYDLDLL